MSEKRFEYDEKNNMIYDNKGVDDYYFLKFFPSIPENTCLLTWT